MRAQHLLMLTAFVTAVLIAGVFESVQGSPTRGEDGGENTRSRHRVPWGHTDSDHHQQRNHPHSDHHPSEARDEEGFEEGEAPPPRPRPRPKERPMDYDDEPRLKDKQTAAEKEKSIAKGAVNNNAGATGLKANERVDNTKEAAVPDAVKETGGGLPVAGGEIKKKGNTDSSAHVLLK